MSTSYEAEAFSITCMFWLSVLFKLEVAGMFDKVLFSPGVETGLLLLSSVTVIIASFFLFLKTLFFLFFIDFSGITSCYRDLTLFFLYFLSLVGLLPCLEPGCEYLSLRGVQRTALAACIMLCLVLPLMIYCLNLSVLFWCLIYSEYFIVGSAKWIFLSIMMLSSICLACYFFLIWLFKECLYWFWLCILLSPKLI